MGFLKSLGKGLLETTLRGAFMAMGEEVDEVFEGDGIGEKKEIFDKLLEKWNSIFQMEDFFIDATFSKLDESIMLPVSKQIMLSGYNYEYSDDGFKKGKRNSEKQLTRVKKTDDESIDFACLYKLNFLHFDHDQYGSFRGNTICQEKARTFYFFRYVKDSNILLFRYSPYTVPDKKQGLKMTDMDILELTFESGNQTLSTSIHWQPKISLENLGSEPKLFFEKIGRSDVYENLKKFLHNLKLLTREEFDLEEKRKQEAQEAREEAERQKEEEERKQREYAQKKKELHTRQKKWKKIADECIAEFSAVSALDAFLGSDDIDNSIKVKRAKLAEEYYQKGMAETADLFNRFDSLGVATELGSIEAKRELGMFYYYGKLSELENEEAAGLKLINEAADQGDVKSIEWLKEQGLSNKQTED